MNKRDIIKLLAIAAVLALALALAARIDRRQDSAETEIVRNAVRNAALTCYAVEGAYPVDELNEDGYPVMGSALRYLRENYHLAYDEDRYFVTYEAFAPNLIPSVYVTERGATVP
ncbi:MAG: hypothetical protein IKE30_06085 [Clostridia bacterium]|nr:hypothetical protein [Clostridia bacterium]